MENLPFRPTLFWDTDASALDPLAHAKFIIKRILLKGDVDDFSWARQNYGADKIKEILISDRELDKKSRNFWYTYFNVDESLCTQKQSILPRGLFWRK